MSAQKIVICEDHDIIVDGLQSLLAASENFTFSGHARSEDDLHSILKKENPDILILDLNLRNSDGFSILQNIRKQNPNHLKVLILTMYDDDDLIEKAKQLKANGYLLKNAGNDELLEALNEMNSSDFYLPGHLRLKRASNQIQRDQFVEKMHLTKREIEIIRMIVQGKSALEISETLFLSYHTVRTHRKNILKKLTLNNAADLVRFAYENHLL